MADRVRPLVVRSGILEFKRTVKFEEVNSKGSLSTTKIIVWYDKGSRRASAIGIARDSWESS
jgi:hypothetical protein